MPDRFDIDPAVSPHACVTTVTDGVGYGPFLGTAALGFRLARPHELETDMAVIIAIPHDENPVAPIWPCSVIMGWDQLG